MTEKRFISIGGSLYDTTKAITDGECMGVFIDRSECENVCDLLNEQEEEIQRLNYLVKIATSFIEWNTVREVRKEWRKYLSKVGDVE